LSSASTRIPGIPHIGEGPRDVAKCGVFPPIDFFVDSRPNEAKDGAEFREALADLVDHLVTGTPD